MKIGLHYDEVRDLKWRQEAFGGSNPLVETAERHKNEIIELRGQREELYRLALADGCTGISDDSWDKVNKGLGQWKGVRDPSQPEGYSVIHIDIDAGSAPRKAATPKEEK